MKVGDIYFYPADQAPFVLKLTKSKMGMQNLRRFRFKVLVGDPRFSFRTFVEPNFGYDLVPIAKTHQIVKFLFRKQHLFK